MILSSSRTNSKKVVFAINKQLYKLFLLFSLNSSSFFSIPNFSTDDTYNFTSKKWSDLHRPYTKNVEKSEKGKAAGNRHTAHIRKMSKKAKSEKRRETVTFPSLFGCRHLSTVFDICRLMLNIDLKVQLFHNFYWLFLEDLQH